MDGKTCLECRFGSVKIEVLVPEKYSMAEFVKEKQNFASNLIEVTGGKPIHYSLTLDSAPQSSPLDFKVHCSCILNVDKNDCSKFNLRQDKDCKVKHLAFSKSSASEQIAVKVSKRPSARLNLER